MKLPIGTYQDILNEKPCYDPADENLCEKDWAGTILDILNNPAVPDNDALWVATRKGWLDNETLQLLSAWAGRKALAIAKLNDPALLAICDTIERHANRQATTKELLSAIMAARNPMALDTVPIHEWSARVTIMFAATVEQTMQVGDFRAASAAWNALVNMMLTSSRTITAEHDLSTDWYDAQEKLWAQARQKLIQLIQERYS